jgi:hypothetical protein
MLPQSLHVTPLHSPCHESGLPDFFKHFPTIFRPPAPLASLSIDGTILMPAADHADYSDWSGGSARSDQGNFHGWQSESSNPRGGGRGSLPDAA